MEKTSKSQIKILKKLFELNRELTRKELSEYLDLSYTTFHYSMKSLQIQNFITVRQSTGSGNSHLISLTALGEQEIING